MLSKEKSDPKVAVIGLGKLGLPLYLSLLNSKIPAIGLDFNSELVSALKGKTFKTTEIGVEELLERHNDQINVTTEYSDLSEVEIAYVIVPTPSGPNGDFDSTFVELAIRKLLEVWILNKEEKSIVVVSTVMPGTCSYIYKEIIGLGSQKNRTSVNLIYSPEFIALGSVLNDIAQPDMVLVGIGETCNAKSHLEVVARIVKNNAPISILSLEESELVKLLVNAFVTMKISFANTIAEIEASAPFKISANRVASAIGLDQRINGKYLHPGLAFGGPCFPRDNKALISFSKTIKLEASLAEATDRVNLRQTQRVISEIKVKYPNVETIAICGLSYKKNSVVTEESAALKIANALSQSGYTVSAWDALLKERPTDLVSDVSFVTSVSSLAYKDLLIKTQDTTELKPIVDSFANILDFS